jgi:hypothetical protein
MLRAAGLTCLAGFVAFALCGCTANDGQVLAVRGASVTTTDACAVGHAPFDDDNDPDLSERWDTRPQPSTVLAHLPLASATICQSIVPNTGRESKAVPASALSELTVALGQPDSEQWTGGCTLEAWLGPTIVVVDSMGAAINAYIPEGACRKPLPKTRETIERVSALVDLRS